MNYFLGVDAGGTKTRAVIIDENSKILGEAWGGPANYHNLSLEQATKNVFQTVENVISKSLLNEAQINWCTIGIAGCDTQKDHDRLKQSFSEKLGFFANKLTVVNDTVIGLYSGTLPPALVVICGTGSNVYGKNDHGEEATAGNWGYFLGDKGSGYVLGKRMFEKIVAAHEGTEEPTILTEKLANKLNLKSPEEILNWYNDNRPTVHEISDFAPIVIEACEENDEVAKQLLEQTVMELGKSVIAVVKRLKIENEANRIVIVGGLFESKYFRALFEGHITALLKRVRIIKPLVSPAVGAAIMAKQEFEKRI